ncbi:helix-turn-helix domain-containing protein [Frisingicoccus sp.]|jgi:predicted transcriptional regulator|uniref:helix-turn-helix domain-containing protein n=1 Tax=Frisingicoccus sp. TaxID=1918627 RepID=UPI0015C1853C|nr:helix-turn-helix domain-containing protein [Frisingicoccus sp.]MEE0751961.1 helix-turn-helix domain-containing protein [Frisingicoccus sp.]
MGIQIHLKELLRERGMTGKELAAKLDITEANLSIFVSGKSKAVRFTTLEKLCEILDCDVSDIIRYHREE